MAPASRIDLALVKAAMALRQRRLLNRVEDGGVFALRVPTSPDTMYGKLIRREGECLMTIVVGPDALDRVCAMHADPCDAEFEKASMMTCGIEPLGNIDPEFRGVIKRAGLEFRRTDFAPMFSRKKANQHARDLNRTDTRTMLFILNAVLRSDRAGTFRPGRPGVGVEIPMLVVTGEADDPSVETATTPIHWSGQILDDAAEMSVLPAGDDDAVPDPGDLAGWKAADAQACGRIARAVIHAGFRARGPLREFFNDDEHVNRCLASAREDLVLSAFEWIFAAFRPRKNSPTLLELALAGDLPPAARALLDARKNARSGFYRVTEIRRGESFDVVDVARGTRATIHDKAGSESVERDIVFVASLYTAGSFTFAAMLSPPFRGASAEAAIAYLERSGAGPGLSNLSSHLHLAGHLFALYERWASGAALPQIANTDGEPFALHNAVFRAADPEGARAQLEARRDVDFDENDDAFVWLRRPKRKGADESGTVLGTIRIVGDELLLRVNSEERLEQAREWLESIPGVRFEATASKSIEDLFANELPLDDRMPDDGGPMPPEIHDLLQKVIHDRAMAWIDEPIPALDGKTPRSACRSAAGRMKVRVLINTWPEQQGPDGRVIALPRAEMFRALGLDEVEAAN